MSLDGFDDIRAAMQKAARSMFGDLSEVGTVVMHGTLVRTPSAEQAMTPAEREQINDLIRAGNANWRARCATYGIEADPEVVAGFMPELEEEPVQ